MSTRSAATAPTDREAPQQPGSVEREAPQPPRPIDDPVPAEAPAGAPVLTSSTDSGGPGAGPAEGTGTALSANLQELLERLPSEPGVYLMKDRKGKVIYVGKAQNLRQRVRSYFTRSGDTRRFVALLERLLGDIETVVTGNEKEALLLENNLIKQHRPRFNVKLVDDKNFLVLRLDEHAQYPRLEVMRRMRDDGAKYFGPYHSATSCRQTLQVVNRHFKLRTCTDQVMHGRKRPCLQYQIKRCDAPCVFPVPDEQYGEQVRDVALFLGGKDQELTERLRSRMLAASESMDFEIAGAIRDQLKALEQTLEQQRVVSAQFVDQDVFGYFREGDVLEIAVLQVRQGKLLGRRTYHFTGQEFPDEEVISSFVGLYYDLGNMIPDEVLLPLAIEDQRAKQEWLREQAGQRSAAGGVARGKGGLRVEVLMPKRGPRARLVELASKNAAVAFHTRRDKRRDTEEALAKLQKRLNLKRVPRRIECYDISHLQGTDTVASRVVFVDGEPAPAEYRTFKVRTVRNDDFAAMYEVLCRRFRRAREAAGLPPPGAAPAPNGVAAAHDAAPAYGRPSPAPAVGEDQTPGTDGLQGEPEEDAPDAEPKRRSSWAMPDLIVIDGGKGQLGTALAALKDTGLDLSYVDLIGLAKEREDQSGEKQPDRVFLPKAKDPIRLRPNTAELFVLSHIRDEAHRFAVTFHQKQRSKRTVRSALADIPGVGPRRQAELLRAFGSVKRIRAASVEELRAVKGMSQGTARAVLRHLGQLPAEALEEADGVLPGSTGGLAGTEFTFDRLRGGGLDESALASPQVPSGVGAAGPGIGDVLPGSTGSLAGTEFTFDRLRGGGLDESALASPQVPSGVGAAGPGVGAAGSGVGAAGPGVGAAGSGVGAAGSGVGAVGSGVDRAEDAAGMELAAEEAAEEAAEDPALAEEIARAAAALAGGRT